MISNDDAKSKIVDHLAGGVFWFLNDESEDESAQEELLTDCQDLTWVAWESLNPEVIEIHGDNSFTVKITTDIAGVIPFMEGKLDRG